MHHRLANRGPNRWSCSPSSAPRPAATVLLVVDAHIGLHRAARTMEFDLVEVAGGLLCHGGIEHVLPSLNPSARKIQETSGTRSLLFAPQHFSQGLADLDSAVVANESLFPESVHEEIDSRTGSADHLRQNLVTYSGEFGN